MHVFESINTQRYAKCIEVSKRIRWDIERDVIRGRDFDADHKFLPDGLSFADRIESLSADERRLFSQIQGRTYANMFGLCERFIGRPIGIATGCIQSSSCHVCVLDVREDVF